MLFSLAQLNYVTGDLEGNTRKMIEAIDRSRSSGAGIVVFSEMSVTGYCVSDLMEDNVFVVENKRALQRVADAARGIVAVVGFIDYEEGKTNEDGTLRKYNAAAVIEDGRIVGISHKTLLPNYRYFDDKRYFRQAERRRPIEVTLDGRKERLGVSICEDMWDDNYEIKPVRELARQGADIIINLNASPFVPGKHRTREGIIRRHIETTGKPFVYVNNVGASDNGKNIIPFDGRSTFFDSAGNLIAIGKQFEEDMLLVDFDLNRGTGKPVEEPPFHREREIFEALVMSLRDYAAKTGHRKAIIPLSGGIDSALGMAISVEAFGKENVRAFNLPSRYNTGTTKEIARKMSENLGVEYGVVPIQEINDTIVKVFESSAHAIANGVAKENIQAWVWGLLMMIESNDSGALLISNGNETEIGLGYCTLYGDMAGGISVIGDLPKTDVYAVARYYNQSKGFDAIPSDALTIIPSAELAEGQYDPFDYPAVAPIVNEIAERRLSPAQLVERFRTYTLDQDKFRPDASGRTIYDRYDEESFTQLVYRCYNLFRRSVYKRLQGPPIIAVSERAFGFDLRETIINSWTGRQD